MKKLFLTLGLLLSFLVINSQTVYSTILKDSVIDDKIPIMMQLKGTCSSPDGPMYPTTTTPPSYTWLQNNGYCNPNTYGNNPTVCWEFTPTSSSVSINSGYSVSGCNNVSFSSFNLYDNSCNLIGTGLNFSGLIPGQTYVWCMTANAWGGGPSCTGFNDFCPYYFNNAVLPIDLLFFMGYNKGNFNHLEWVSVSEINNDFYVIERSTDGNIWEVVRYVEGAGYSNNYIIYELDDDSYSNDLNYYRLTQVDYDGEYKIYDIIVIDNRIESKKLTKVLNYMGLEVDKNSKGLLIEVYDDGTIKKVFRQ